MFSLKFYLFLSLMVTLSLSAFVPCSTPLCFGCSNPDATCTTCNMGYTNQSGLIYSTGTCDCPSNFYLNVSKSFCDFCPVRCLTCTNSTFCTSCIQDHELKDGNCLLNKSYTYTISNEGSEEELTNWRMVGYRFLNMTSTLYFRGYFENCSKMGISFFGGSLFNWASATTKPYYNLPRHQWVRVRFQFIALDDWRNNTLVLVMDNVSNYMETHTVAPVMLANQSFDNTNLHQDLCDSPNYPDSLGIMEASINHTASMIKLRIHTDYLNRTDSNVNLAWGFRNFILIVGQCAPTCTRCRSSSATDCLACIENYILVDGSCRCDTTKNNFYLDRCLPKCQTDQLAIMYNQTCLPCQYLMYDCLRCSSYNVCTECLPGSFMNSTGQCVRSCQIGHYNDHEDKSCKECPVDCRGCSKEEECYECNQNRYKHRGVCIITCPDFTFNSSDGRCRRCPKDCKTCTDQLTCTVCRTDLSFSFILNNGSCDLPCGVRSTKKWRNNQNYIVYDASLCTNVTCNSSCLTCFGTTSLNCLSCPSGKVLSKYQCVSSCPSGTYNNTGQCSECSLTCTTCQGPDENDCLTCPSGSMFFQNRCLNACPTGFYASDSTCIACANNCTACTNSTTCLSCQPFLYFWQGKCLPTCPNSTYLSVLSQNCLACQTNCQSCIESLCFRCKNGTLPQYFLSNGRCVAQCEEGKHPTLSNVCEWNDPLCATYTLNSSGSFCTSCQFFYPVLVLVNGVCKYNCPAGSFFSSTTFTCSNCATNCTECTGTSISQCLRCKSGLVLYGSQCLEACPLGFAAGQDGRCIQCPTGCSKCNTVGDCFSCYGNLTLTDYKCMENCTALGQFLSGTTCLTCPAACQTCNTSTSCIKCNSNLYLVTSGGMNCTSTCPAKTFPDNSTFLCVLCPPACATCTSVSNCTSCTMATNYYLYNGSCLAICPNSTYMDFFNQEIRICKLCSPECSVCFGATYSQCINCTKGYVLDMTSCVQNCSIGKYIDNSSHCDSCKLICKTCFGPADFQCYSCNYGFYLYKYRCYQICPAGTVNTTDATGLKICIDCPENCLICLANGSCTTCAPMSYLTADHKCMSVCPYGWTVSNDSYTCNVCPSSCQTCTSNGCTSCIPGFYIYNYNECVHECPYGMYADVVNGRCSQDCPPGCVFCSSRTTCIMCIVGYYLVNNQSCYAVCQAGKYGSLVSNVNECLNCVMPCLTCNNITWCTSCISGYNLNPIRGECVTTCPTGYYSVSATCLPCPVGCLNCTYTACQVCSTGLSLTADGKCIPITPNCLYQSATGCVNCSTSCIRCLNSSYCVQCNAGLMLLPNGTCVSACPASTYPSLSSQCQPCDPNCLNCTLSPTNCTSCTKLFLLDGRCVYQCPDYMYANVVSRTCEPCYAGCAKCDGPQLNECYNCSGYIYQGECVAYCPPRTYQYFTNCQQCHQSCLTCLGPQYDQCTSCDTQSSTPVLFNGTCTMGCPSGTFLFLNRCEACPPGCNDCVNSTHCQGCTNGFMMLKGICVNVCPNGTYSFMGECLSCQSPCLTCNSSTNCRSCVNGLILLNGTCIRQCPVGTYLANGQCLSCAINCQSCGSFGNCTLCVAPYFVYNGICSLNCPVGFYRNMTTLNCTACWETCASCSGRYASDCTYCQLGYFLNNGSCVLNCPMQTYKDVNSRKCVICPPGCLNCSVTTCFQCQTGYTLNSAMMCSNTTVCDATCLSCFSTGNTSCLSCPNNKVLYNGSCYDSCPNSHYALSGKCYQCVKPCLQCSSSTQCQNCQAGFVLVSGICTVSCPPQFKLVAGNCIQDSTCMIFSGDTCLQCSQGYFMVNGVCQTTCPDGTYADLSSRMCQQCNLGCTQCNSTFCIVCSSGLINYNGQCVEVCPAGTYRNWTSCMVCPMGCVLCNSTSCFQCQQGLVLSNNTCQSACRDGTYLLNGICINCTAPCLTCQSPTICLSCPIGYVLNPSTSQCVTTCPVGTYNFSGSCQQCSTFCQNCTTTGCVTCQNGYYLYNSQCVPACPAGMYTQSGQCTVCSATCLECSGTDTNCLTCPNGMYLFNGQCLQQCPNGYYKSVTMTCVPCSPICQTCQSATICTKCVDGYTIDTTGKCYSSCPVGQYLVNGACVACSIQCATCFGPYPDQCASCLSPRVLYLGQCVLTCPPTTYLTGAQCLPCSGQCLTCNGSNCVQCLPGYNLLKGSCVVTCPANTYVNNGTCQDCEWSCVSCSSDTNCLSCVTPLILVSGDCVTACPLGTYYHATKQTCVDCDSACQNCTAITCLACKSGYIMYNGQCLTDCPTGTYLNSSKCVPCSGGCAVCTNTTCISCMPPMILFNGTCLQQCPLGYTLVVTECIKDQPCYLYFDTLCVATCPTGYFNQSGQCLKCPVGCIKCTNANTCQGCTSGFYQNGTSCLATCPSGTYADPILLQCQTCKSNCLTCESATICLTCPTGLFYDATTKSCLTKCLDGTYSSVDKCLPCMAICLTCQTNNTCTQCLNPLTTTANNCSTGCLSTQYKTTTGCVNCDPSCLTCISAGIYGCTSCASGKILYNMQCISGCPTGMYLLDGTCAVCPTQCLTCSSPSNCTSCQSMILFNGGCFQTCPTGTYLSGNSCLNCTSSCAVCNSTACTQCLTGFLSNGTCIPTCPVGSYVDSSKNCLPCSSPCLTCSNIPTNCTSCVSPTAYYESKCYIVCPAGTFLNGTVCTVCVSPCLTCSSATSCQSCAAGYLLSGNTCLKTCPTNSYVSTTSAECLPCPTNCSGCTNNNNCTGCTSGKLLNGICYNVCPNGYYSGTANCEPCPVGCLTCGSATNCTTCQSGLVLLSGNCSANCPSGKYLQQGTCQNCDVSCSTCNGPSNVNCISCKTGYSNYSGQCLSTCPSGYTAVSGVCQQCNTSCLTCSGNTTNCTSCPTNYVLTNGQCLLPNITCPTGQYYDTTKKSCQSCDVSCKTCSGSGYTNCLTCATGYILTNGICQSSCSSTSYYNNATNTCLNCVSPCLTCNSSTFCLTCQSTKILYNGTCVDSCPTGTFAFNQQCYACSQNCSSCLSAIQCLVCTSPKVMYNGGCYDSCPSSTYFNGTECRDCQAANCSICTASGCTACNTGMYLYQGQCYQLCPGGTIAATSPSNQCQNCTSPCSTCSVTITNCTSCQPTYALINGSCTLSCPPGYYINSGVCTVCDTRCNTCLPDGNCSACKTGYTLTLGKCTTTCPDGKYPDSSGNCQSCSSYCVNCTSASNCSKCLPPNVLNAGACQTSCPANYYNNSGICSPCATSCAVCGGNTSCTQCQSGTVLYNQQCYSNCPSGTYLTATNTCVKCPENCMNCSSSGCSVCLSGYVRSTDGNCTNLCPSGSYMVSGSCQPCSVSNCSKCNSTDCTQCLATHYLYDGQCYTTCPSGTYQNGTSCTQCTMTGCSSCPNNNCQECNSQYLNIFYNGSQTITSCEMTCPHSHYLSDNKNCYICPQQCETCNNANNCTVCATGYYLFNELCLQTCPDGYYGDAGQCIACPSNCATCQSATNCTSCAAHWVLIGEECRQPNCDNCLNCTDNFCNQCNAPYLVLQGACVQTCPQQYYYTNETHCADCMKNCQICPNATYCQLCIPQYGFSQATSECIPQVIIVYGQVANMSSFTSNLTETMSAVYLTSSAGPVVFGQMSSTYFNIEFLQFMFFHNTAASNNPEVSTFLNSLELMSFKLPFEIIKKESTSRRLLAATQTSTVLSNTFLYANQSILILMVIFLSIYIVVWLLQKYMDSCFSRCPKARFYSTEICEFLLKRFKWAYFDFIMWLSYVPFLFFSLVQLQNFSLENSDKAVSSLISLVIIIVYPLYPFFIAWLIKSHYEQLKEEDTDKLLQMSMGPYVSKIQRDKVSLAYAPLKYLRKLLFAILVATIHNGVVVLSLLLALNVAYILFICIKRPHTTKLYFGFDLAIEAILLGFEIFMLIYVTQGGNKIDIMSIITHTLGFVMANLSLVIAIILNLIAYFKVIMCLWELGKHLKEKGEQREQIRNIDDMLQEEKQLQGLRRGDEATEHGDIPPEEDFDLEKFDHGVRFQDDLNPPENGSDFLFDEKQFMNLEDINNPNQNNQGAFEQSDHQLTDIIKNKKKPTPRVTLDKRVPSSALDDLQALGKHLPNQLQTEELGIKKFKKTGKGIPELGTTAFNIKGKPELNEKVGNAEELGVRKKKGGAFDHLDSLNSIEEQSPEDKKFKKQTNEQLGDELPRMKRKKRKDRQDTDNSMGVSHDSQQNLVLKGKQNGKQEEIADLETHVPRKPVTKKQRQMDRIKKGLEELESDNIDSANTYDKEGNKKSIKQSKEQQQKLDDFAGIELRTNSRVDKKREKTNAPGFNIDDEDSPSVRIQDKRFNKAKNKDSKTIEDKELTTKDRNFGKMIKNTSGQEQEAWAQAYESDPQAQIQATDLNTKKVPKLRQAGNFFDSTNQVGTSDSKLQAFNQFSKKANKQQKEQPEEQAEKSNKQPGFFDKLLQYPLQPSGKSSKEPKSGESPSKQLGQMPTYNKESMKASKNKVANVTGSDQQEAEQELGFFDRLLQVQTQFRGKKKEKPAKDQNSSNQQEQSNEALTYDHQSKKRDSKSKDPYKEEDSTRKLVTGKQTESLRKDGGLKSNQPDDFDEDMGGKARRQKIAEIQKKNGGRLGLNDQDDFGQDQGDRRKQKAAEDQRKKGGRLQQGGSDDFVEDEGGRKRQQQQQDAERKKAGRLQQGQQGNFTEDQGGRKKQEYLEDEKKKAGRLNQVGADMEQDFGGRKRKQQTIQEPNKKFRNEQFLQQSQDFEEQNMSPAKRKQIQLADSTKFNKAGSMFGPSRQEFIQDEPGVRRRRSDMQQVKSTINRKSQLQQSQQEQQFVNEALKELKRTVSRQGGLRSGINPRGQYIKEEDGQFEESQGSRRIMGNREEKARSRFGLRSNLVIGTNQQDIEDEIQL